MSFFSKIKTELSLIPGTLQALPGEILNTVGRIGESGFVPGDELAKGIGASLALPGLQKKQDDLNETWNRLQGMVLTRMKEAKRSGDNETYERMSKLAMTTGQLDANLLEAATREAPTNTQILASAGELALIATLGASRLPGLPSGKFASHNTIKAVSQAQQLKNLKALQAAGFTGRAANIAKVAAKEAGIGSAFFALIEAQREDATTEDIIRAGEMGLVLGPLFVGATAVGVKGLGFVGGKVAGPVKKGLSALEKKAQETIAPTVSKGDSVVDKTLSFIGEKSSVKKFAAESYIRTTQAARQFANRFVDRYSSIKRVEDTLLEVKGKPLKESEKVYRDARLFEATSNAEAEARVVKLADSLRPYDNIRDKAKAYLIQLDFIDRAKLGNKVPGGQTLKDLQKDLRKMIAEIGPDDMQKVGAVRQIVRDYNRELLQRRVDAGLIDKATMGVLLEAHPNYIPHNVIMAIDEKVVSTMSTGGSLNVPKTDIMKAVGSIRDIQDPFVAMVQRTPIATRIIEKNRLLNNLVKAQEKFKVVPGMKKIKSSVKAPKFTEKVTLFRNGKKEVWAVPKDLVEALKNTDSPVMPGMFSLITLPARLLKKGATQLNLSFAIPNKFRDEQTAAITANAFIEQLAKKTGVTPRKLGLTPKQIQTVYKRSGGFGASIFREGEEKIFQRLQSKGLVEKVVKDYNPISLIEKANETFEKSTRMRVFKTALERGLSPKDAAFVSREATIDFAKMGSWMRPLNRAVPFLNARVQGFINIPRALAANPETFSRMQLYTAVYPTLFLHQHNRRFESYGSIAQYWKDKYWIIMTGEVEAPDAYTGEKTMIPQFITIPKGEGQALVSGPIGFYLDRADGVDFRATSEMLGDVLGSASPLEFQTFGSSNFWSSLISQFGPVATIPVGLASNQDPFYGRPIIPEERLKASPEKQVKQTTPESIRALAGVMNASPAQVEFVLNSFGGLPQDTQRLVDLVFGAFREGDLVEDLEEESLSQTPFGVATQAPIVRRFTREVSDFYSPESDFRKRQKEQIERGVLDKTIDVKDRATEILNTMNKKETREEKLNYMNSLGDELTPTLRKKIRALQTGRETFEVLRKNDPVEVRARYILWRLTEMENNGIDKRDLLEYMVKLEESGILTQKVKQTIRVLQTVNR